MCERTINFLGPAIRCFLLFAVAMANATAQETGSSKLGDSPEASRDPLSITLIKMDLDNARNALRKCDLDDDGSLSKNRMGTFAVGRASGPRFST